MLIYSMGNAYIRLEHRRMQYENIFSISLGNIDHSVPLMVRNTLSSGTMSNLHKNFTLIPCNSEKFLYSQVHVSIYTLFPHTPLHHLTRDILHRLWSLRLSRYDQMRSPRILHRIKGHSKKMSNGSEYSPRKCRSMRKYPRDE